MKRFWYSTKKEGEILKIYYKLTGDNEGTQFYQVQTMIKGNKRVRIIKTLMRNDWPIITKRLYFINPKKIRDELEWKEVDEEEMLGYLKRGNPNDDARSSLYQFFGYSIFKLTDLEYQYFTASFSNLNRLVTFYHAIKKECEGKGAGYTYRNYGGRTVIITPTKIKKAMTELFNVDPQEILFNKKDKNNGNKN